MSDDADSSPATPVASNIANTTASTGSSSQANGTGVSNSNGVVSKGVTFAPSPPRSALLSSSAHSNNNTSNNNNGKSNYNNSNSSLMDPTNDAALSRPALLSLLAALRSDLSSTRMDLSAERVLRKRKEKNLVKLAKQLNSRSTAMDETAAKLAKLESKYDETKRELEELTTTHERLSRNHHQEMTEQQTSLRTLSRRHDARVAELTSQHSAQVEEMRRRLLEATLEGDRLRTELAQGQMRAEPGRADEVVGRTLRESRKGTTTVSSEKRYTGSSSTYRSVGDVLLRRMGVRAAPLAVVGLLLIPLLAVYLAAMNGGEGIIICAPCRPGTALGESSYANAAPWWVPSPLKRPAFSVFCSDRTIRTGIEWTGTTRSSSGGGMGKLRIVDADLYHADAKVGPGSKQSILMEKKATSATVSVDGREIRATLHANGRGETMAAPWARRGKG